jgi:hypothetical protein
MLCIMRWVRAGMRVLPELQVSIQIYQRSGPGLPSFPVNAYSGVVFQVENPHVAALNFKNLIGYVQNGIGNYAGDYGLSDRAEVGYVYDVQDGSSPQYYRDLIIAALQELGYEL